MRHEQSGAVGRDTTGARGRPRETTGAQQAGRSQEQEHAESCITTCSTRENSYPSGTPPTPMLLKIRARGENFGKFRKIFDFKLALESAIFGLSAAR